MVPVIMGIVYQINITQRTIETKTEAINIAINAIEAAKEYAVDQKAVRVVLVDGAELTRLMIDYGVGVSTQRTFSIKEIDTDYFEE